MVKHEIVERKVVSLKGYLKELYCATDINWEKYITDNRSKRFVERLLQISIETMIDIGQHIIADEGFREPGSYRDVFKVLVENQVIAREKLPKLEKIASFRNVLVHHYEKTDDSIVYGIFKNNLGDIEDFITDILAWLKSN